MSTETKNEKPSAIEKPFALDIEAVLKAVSSSQEGIEDSEAQSRLEKDGPNRLPEGEKEGLLKRFFKHFHDTLIYVLLAAALVTAILQHWIDTIVILGVVVINAIIGFIQEGKAEKALEGIRKMLSASAQVLRGGDWKEVPAEEVVVGDVVRLRSGDRVPADLRLIEVNNLRIEESALTGESVPSEKNTEIVDSDAGVGDRSSMAFSGSMVTSGRGIGVITAIGVDTEIGRINKMISEVQSLETPLTRQMAKFSKGLAVLILVMAAGMFAYGWFFHDFPITDLFFAAIGFAVAAIPEGLPAIMTITLAIGVQSMAKQKAITRRLNAVETLGSVTVVCSDKTGTLTKNEMTVRSIVTTHREYSVTGIGYSPEGEVTFDGEPAALSEKGDLQALTEVMVVCNDSGVREKEGNWIVIGEPTEGSLITLGKKLKFDREIYKRVAAIPFDSDNKFMVTLNRVSGRDGRKILLKGAPDRLLDRSSQQRGKGGQLENLDREYWEKQIKSLAGNGLRVLAAAYKDTGESHEGLSLEDVKEQMVFLGLVGILDPPRPEAIEAIRECKQAGIKVKMITGDHAETAIAIGREMGITEDNHAVSGHELENASDEELVEIAANTNIFARTSPEHKLRLVKALQARGEVIAMTGDGVNDAPALKRADVGVAMGIKGTEATKEAADIVLADDNFKTIERAVLEGRTIYDNLRKAILFILPTNGAQAFVVLTAIVLGIGYILTPVQILWVNMVTAVTLALALAFEPAEPGVMKRPPRDPTKGILGLRALWLIGFVSLLVGGSTIVSYYIISPSPDDYEALALARTFAVNVLVFGQIFYLFNSRFIGESSLRPDFFFSNKAVWFAILIMLLLQASFVYLPFMNTAFGTGPLPLSGWLIPAAVGLVIFFIVEGEKAISRKL